MLWNPPTVWVTINAQSKCLEFQLCHVPIFVYSQKSVPLRDGKFGPKVGQIGPKWDKTGKFSHQISVQLVSLSLNVLKYDLKNSRIYPIWSQSYLLLGPNLLTMLSISAVKELSLGEITVSSVHTLFSLLLSAPGERINGIDGIHKV